MTEKNPIRLTRENLQNAVEKAIADVVGDQAQLHDWELTVNLSNFQDGRLQVINVPLRKAEPTEPVWPATPPCQS